jgi:hypothetical protein
MSDLGTCFSKAGLSVKKNLYSTTMFRTTKGDKSKQKPETANGKGVMKTGP